MDAQTDKIFMNHALQLALKGRGKTHPNPMVGAVIVKKNRIISKGYHRAVGKEHAEVMAVKNASESIKGATIYVNLEPCCHYGRTGPCTDLLIKEKIKKVVISTKDSNELVNGKGIKKLRAAGIEVVNNVLKDEAYFLNDSYLSYHANKKPFVILKMAQTLDGKIATLSGESKYLSSKQSLQFVHQLRSEIDAVAIGSGTLKKDDPRLNVRLVKGNNPYRIILSKKLNIDPASKLINNNKDYKTIIASTENSIKKQINSNKKQNNLIYWSLQSNGSLLDLDDLIARANDFGIKSILFEGGAKLAASLMKNNLVDKLILVTVPKIMGDGLNTFAGLKNNNLSDMITFNKQYSFTSGCDNIFVGYPKK